jgi:hypothetical protein
VSYLANNESQPWNTVMTLNLPRETLVSHPGFEPRGGLCRCGGTTAGRLLFELIRHADNSGASSALPADSFMQLAVYDLVGALFAPSDPWPAPWLMASRPMEGQPWREAVGRSGC